MAPNLPGNYSHRRRRPRRAPRPPPLVSIARERLPIGALPSRRLTPGPANHITVVPRPTSANNFSQNDPEDSEIPVLTKPSFLTETDTGLDLHHQSTDPPRNATFADMARAGLGPNRDYLMQDHMASQEPVPLSHYVKFVKRHGRHKGASSQPNEDNGSWRLRTPDHYTEKQDSFSSTHTYVNDPSFEESAEPWTTSPKKATIPPIHPVEALQQHFHLVKATFGRDLPSATHLQANEGQRDGEVQFTIDGGGDVCAHSWSASQYQWVNVGMLSYRRKAIEGSLGVRQLKGQKIGAQMPRNLVEQFLALAKQFEEENSMTSLSPTHFDSITSHTRIAPLVAVPLVSPRPTRPNIAFMPGIDSPSSFSSGGLPFHQVGLRTPDLHRQSLKLSEDEKSNLNRSQHTPSGDLDDASMTSQGDDSPLARRKAPERSANAVLGLRGSFVMPSTFERSQSIANDLVNKDASSIKNWQEEQLRLQQRCLEPTVLDLCRNSFSTNPDVILPRTGERLQGFGPSRNQATSNRMSAMAEFPKIMMLKQQPVEDWRVIQCAMERKFPNHNRSEASSSEIWQHPTLDNKKNFHDVNPQSELRKIWGDPWTHHKLSNEELLTKCQSFKPPKINGPFFGASDNPESCSGTAEDYKARDKQTWGSLDAIRLARIAKMRVEARSLLPHAEKEVEEMIQDPLSQLLWAVNFNLNSYKEKEPGTRDYFERQIERPLQQQVDTSGRCRGPIESSSQTSDEVVFKGRNSYSCSFQSTSSTQTVTRANYALTPKQIPRSARGAVHSMSFEEQIKRRSREPSLGW